MDTRTLPVTIPVTVNNHNFAAEVKAFASAILKGRTVITDGDSGAKTVSLGVALTESFTTGKLVKIYYYI